MKEKVKEAAYGNLGTSLPVAACLALFPWVLTGMRVFFNISYWKDDRGRPEPVSMYLAVSVIITVPTLIWGLLAWNRARILAERGELIDGRVVAMSALRKHGNSPVTVAYEVAATEYRKKKDMSRHLSLGTPVQVLYDPKNPRRAIVLDLSYRLKDPGPDLSDMI